MHPLQQAFIDHDGFLCGYGTPGQICSAIGMAEEARRGVPRYLTDNLSAAKTALIDGEQSCGAEFDVPAIPALISLRYVALAC